MSKQKTTEIFTEGLGQRIRLMKLSRDFSNYSFGSLFFFSMSFLGIQGAAIANLRGILTTLGIMICGLQCVIYVEEEAQIAPYMESDQAVEKRCAELTKKNYFIKKLYDRFSWINLAAWFFGLMPTQGLVLTYALYWLASWGEHKYDAVTLDVYDTKFKELFAKLDLAQVSVYKKDKEYLTIDAEKIKKTSSIPMQFYLRIIADYLNKTFPAVAVFYQNLSLTFFIYNLFGTNLKFDEGEISKAIAKVSDEVAVVKDLSRYFQVVLTHPEVHYEDGKVFLDVPLSRITDPVIEGLLNEKAIIMNEGRLFINSVDAIKTYLSRLDDEKRSYQPAMSNVKPVDEKKDASVDSIEAKFIAPPKYYIPPDKFASSIGKWGVGLFSRDAKKPEHIKTADFGEYGSYSSADFKDESLTRIIAVEASPHRPKYYVKLSDAMAKSDRIHHLKYYFEKDEKGKNRTIPLIETDEKGRNGIVVHPRSEYKGDIVQAKLKRAGKDISLCALKEISKVQKDGSYATLFVMDVIANHGDLTHGHKRKHGHGR